VKGPVQTLTATPNRAVARRIARTLVDRGLAACVQIVGPIESIYRWQGRVETAREWLCLIKTNSARFREVNATIAELHPYDTPEIVALPIAAGSQRYLDWLTASVRWQGDASQTANCKMQNAEWHPRVRKPETRNYKPEAQDRRSGCR